MRFAVQNLLLVIFLSFAGQAQFTQARYSDNDAQEIRRTMLEVERAFVQRDPEPLERILIDGYVGIRGKPVFNAREQLAAMVRYDAAAKKSGKKLDFETLSYESDLPDVHLFGDSAIVNVLKKNLWRYKDDRCLTQYQSTELWLKLDGAWKVAAGHVSTFQCESMPWQPPHPAVAATRALSKPTKFISTSVETELREMLSRLTDAGLRGDNNSDAFQSEFVATGPNGAVSSDRSVLLAALRIPTGRNNDRFRDDEVFLNFGSAAMYLFRIRSIPKTAETAPQPPIVYSVMFVRSGTNWQIAASHASTITD